MIWNRNRIGAATDLSKKYKPMLWLRCGQKNWSVVASGIPCDAAF